MFDKVDITKVLFLDIETVSGVKEFTDLHERHQKLWATKAKSALRKFNEPLTSEEITDSYNDKAGIFAEFAKIVCISVGIVVKDSQTGVPSLRIKSFADRDEKVLLLGFVDMVNKYYNNPNRHYFCGHNIREFDIPFICRRLVINRVTLPETLNLAGKKPWETKHLLDTLEFWKFGDYKNYTSLNLLTGIFDIPTPKDDIDGSQVGRVFWEEDDLERIAVYCEKDVIATTQLFMRFIMQPLIEDIQTV